MTIDELIKLNSFVFGVDTPKISVRNTKYSLDINLNNINPENVFYYVGSGVFFDVTIYNGKEYQLVHAYEYINLKDVLDLISTNNLMSLNFVIIPPQIYVGAVTNNADYTRDPQTGYLSPIFNTIANPLIVPTNVTNQPAYYGVAAIASVARVYILEYDQTKLMKCR